MTQSTKNGEKKSSPKPTYNPEPLSKQELINQGEQAAALLNAQIYNEAHLRSIQQLQDQWMETHPHEREKREGLYHAMRGISQASLVLAAMVNEAVALSDDDFNKARLSDLYG
tara:strand:+ start:691 stop:1029 length:339 start_codon:yes stop_codon:yes gene_type:complete